MRPKGVVKKRVYIPVTETIYRVHIQWMPGDAGEEVVEAQLRHPKEPADVEVTWVGGGPCWAPYFTIDGKRQDSVEKFAGKVLRLLVRYKGVKIEAGAVLQRGV